MRDFYRRLRNIDAVYVVGMAGGAVGLVTLSGAWVWCGLALMVFAGVCVVLEA